MSVVNGSITLVSVYPDLLGTYGDAGNVKALSFQAKRHNIELDVIIVSPGSEIPRTADLYVLGGGEDSAQTAAVRALNDDGGLNAAAANGAVIFAVCAGYQMLGESFPDATGSPVAGLDILNVYTDRLPTRAVGELAAESLIPGVPILTGYENHGGATHLGKDVSPLAKVAHGVGNGDGYEGAVHGHIVGTYLHGPGLARNPRLADTLLGWCVGHDLPEMPSAEMDALRADRLRAANFR